MGDRLATIDMGRKVGGCSAPFYGGTGSPSNTIRPGPRPTSVPSFILIHPTTWPQSVLSAAVRTVVVIACITLPNVVIQLTDASLVERGRHKLRSLLVSRQFEDAGHHLDFSTRTPCRWIGQLMQCRDRTIQVKRPHAIK